MRWIKHMTRSRLDEKISAVVSAHGLEAYGFYWTLLEIVAESMDKTDRCELTHTVSRWADILGVHHHQVRKYFGVLSEFGLIATLELPSGYPPVTPPSNQRVTQGYRSSSVRVEVPNLLKYRDEYSKKSGHSPEDVRSKDTDTDTDKPLGKADPLDELVEPFALRIHSKHPVVRRCGLREVKDKLKAIARTVPAKDRAAKLVAVEENHASWCESPDWQKEGGKYAKGLDNWLAPTKHRYDAPCPVSDSTQEEFVYRPMM